MFFNQMKPGLHTYRSSGGTSILVHDCKYYFFPFSVLCRPAAKQLGFDGIHFDQLGNISDSADQNMQMGQNFGKFLNLSQTILNRNYGLQQTFNFVNGFGWNNTELSNIQFPYWEVWNDDIEKEFWQTPSASVNGVYARYPQPGCCGNPPGFTADELMVGRWKVACEHNSSYLLVGNGNQRLQGPYFPGAINISLEEQEEIQQAILQCRNETD
eukprot:m.84809 g.84809  ORF g.84809 m.84809 type:complete len:213 (+) comp12981_c0_seq3:535-1173(+)